MRSQPTDDPLEQAALVWLTRRHSGFWAASDERELAAWLAADPRHRTAWQHAESLWDTLAGLRPFAATEMRILRRRGTTPRAGSGRLPGFALAGVGILVFGLVMLLPGSFSLKEIHQTARGEHRTVTLADDSRIELNTASRVEVDYGLGCRCVRLLDGEAVFHVAHGDPRSFRVAVAQSGIRDIGTDFWVRDDGDKIAVAVIEGEIEVAPNAEDLPSRLKAGDQRAWYRDGRPIHEPARPLADVLAWRKGILVFRDAPLNEVVSEFARYHAVRIELDAHLQGYRLSGQLKSADLDGFLALIDAAYPVTVRRPAPDRLRIDLGRHR